MAFIPIHDPADPQLAPYRAIRDRPHPAGEGFFIGETALVIQAMLERPGCVQSILAAQRHEGRVRQMLERAQGDRDAAGVSPDVFLVPDSIVEPLAGFNLHRGLLALGRRPAPRTLDTLLAEGAGMGAPAGGSPLLLCVEDVNNIDNIGQLFRVAAAFGCAGVLLSPRCHDPLYRKSLRVSCGHALRLPHARSTDWLADLRALRQQHGYQLVGATGAGSMTLAEFTEGLRARPTEPFRAALLVGAEFEGLAAETLEHCSVRLRIPMAPGVDSLNVAVAAAVILSRLAEFAEIARR